MEHDLRLRAAARAIYDTCYPSDDWTPAGFDKAERSRTVHYGQAVGAAQQARVVLAARGELLPLPVFFSVITLAATVIFCL